MVGESVNPVIHLRLAQPSSSRDTDDELLECIAKECISNGVAVVVAKYLKDELNIPPARYIRTRNMPPHESHGLHHISPKSKLARVVNNSPLH